MLTLGFMMIAISPAGGGATNVRYGIVFLGLLLVISGWMFYHKDKKAYNDYLKIHPKTVDKK